MEPFTSPHQQKPHRRKPSYLFSWNDQIFSWLRHILWKLCNSGAANTLVFTGLVLAITSGSVSGQSAEAVVAIVNGQKITLQQVDETIAAQIFPLRLQLYSLRKAALSNLIMAKVIEAEAARRKVSIEELRRRLTVGDVLVTNAQVEDAYEQNASLFALMSAHEAKERLRLDLESQQRMKLFRTAIERLKGNSEIAVFLEQPSFPLELDDGTSPFKGATNPLVTIIEFSDFQCPFCKQVQQTLKLVLEKYPSQVKLVFKHLPLDSHQYSLRAAGASYCAGAQNKFWEFHDALFASGDLTNAGLERSANNLGLNLPQFRKCLDSAQALAAISKDQAKARLLRIESTPSFIINGKVLNGAISFAEFQQLIDRAIGQTSLKPTSTN